MLLASIHRLPELHDWVLTGSWSGKGYPRFRTAMSGHRFGIVGLGNIGAAIAHRLDPFGGEIAWWGPREKDAPWSRRDSMHDLARWCSVLVVAARGDAVRQVDVDVIAAIGAKGLKVNISRGAVIDEEALISALKDGRLGAAALDVFEDEPTPPGRKGVPNVLLSPHIAGASVESVGRLRDAAIRNLSTALDGGPVVNEVTA